MRSKRSNLPASSLRLSPHLAAEIVIEMAGNSTKHTHRHINVCVQCKTTRNLHQHPQWQLGTNTIKYQSRGYSMKRRESEKLAELRERLILTQAGLFLTRRPLTSLTCLNKKKRKEARKNCFRQQRSDRKTAPSSQLRSFFSSSTPSFSSRASFVSISPSSFSICSTGMW